MLIKQGAPRRQRPQHLLVALTGAREIRRGTEEFAGEQVRAEQRERGAHTGHRRSAGGGVAEQRHPGDLRVSGWGGRR